MNKKAYFVSGLLDLFYQTALSSNEEEQNLRLSSP